MADGQEEEKKKYIILKHTSLNAMEDSVNAKLKEKYILYWPLHITDWWTVTFYQAMVQDSVVTAKVSAWVWWTVAISGIAWTVNVSWCGWD